MNKKTKKMVGYLAIAIFAIALAINIKVTLDNPLSMVSNQALALQTSGSSSGGSCQTGGQPNIYCPYWNVTITWTFTGPKYSCTTGGQFKCDTSSGGTSGSSGS